MKKLLCVLTLCLGLLLSAVPATSEVDTQNPSPPSFGIDAINAIGGSCDPSQWIYSPYGVGTNWHCSFTWTTGIWMCTVNPNGHSSCICEEGTGCEV